LEEYLWYEAMQYTIVENTSFGAMYNLILLCSVFARGSADIGGFGEAFSVDLFIPGIASLVNHHSALDNGTSPVG
jgi:hypothetical protein